MIVKRQILETSKEEDPVLSGLFAFMRNLCEKFPEVRASFPERKNMITYVMHDCLFHKETSALVYNDRRSQPPKCKHLESREEAIKLLQALVMGDEIAVQSLASYFH